MVKAIFISSRRPGLTLEEFSTRSAAPHGALVTELPDSAGTSRPTHCAESLTGVFAPTHDACSELWFDDYHAWKTALASRQWSAIVDSGEKLFARPSAYLIGREHVVKS